MCFSPITGISINSGRTLWSVTMFVQFYCVIAGTYLLKYAYMNSLGAHCLSVER